MAISVDGGGIDTFPDYVVDKGQANNLGLTKIPAVFLVNPDTGEMIPIYHIRSQRELEERIYFLLTNRGK